MIYLLALFRVLFAKEGYRKIIEEIRAERADLAHRQAPRGSPTRQSRRANRASMTLMLLAYACFIWGAIAYNRSWPRWIYIVLLVSAVLFMLGAMATDPH